MSLNAGDRLGSYEIIGALGAGGMGEVYRAHDARLHRDVAIKVLADALASDPAQRARFEREARTLAALNHPHIAHVYGFEQFEGRFFLVMELVPGEDLAWRVARGAIPLHEALLIATQTAEALAAAHAEGIVHRDLKPANIKVRADGVVKVLDFGIAKAVSHSATDMPVGNHAEPSDTPTVTAPDMTARGVVVGTAAYMAPEQAKGQPVDKRADIWAFGCVLYEMLVGRRAFDRADASESFNAVLLADPDWDVLPRETPIAIRRLLRRCLTKDRTRRLADISDARLELDEAQSTDAVPPPVRRSTLASRLAWLAAGVALGAVAFVGSQALTSRSSPRPAQLQRMTEAIGNEESPALSPDGKAVAYIAARDGKRQVFVRLLAGGVPLQLTRDDLDHQHPRWAPDSAAIVYFTPGRTVGEPGTIWEIPALGGSPRRLIPAASGADVSRDGRRIAVFQYSNDRVALVTANRDGSALASVALLPESLYGYPRWSPDDGWIAYQRSDSLEFDKRLCIVASAGGEPRDIARADGMFGLTWLADGSGVIYSSSQGSTVLYPPTLNLRVVTVNGTGDRALTFGDVSHVEPDVQSSGVAATRIRANSDIWKIPVDGQPADNVLRAVRVTRQTGVAQVPSTSPDESEVVYLSDSGGHGNLWVASTDGSGARQITFERDSGVSIGVPMWSPTSNQIAFIVTRGGVARNWLVNSDGSDPRDFVGGVMASWSPDGKWFYYALRRKGIFEIEKIAAGGGSPVPVRADDAATPAVGADGTLYWTTPIKGVGGVWEWIIRKARPESGEAATLVRVNGARVPWEFRAVQPILSPDQKWLAQPLVDGATTNLWLIDTHDGSLRMVTDYGDPPDHDCATRVVVPRRQQDLCGGRRNRCGHRPIPESGAGLSRGWRCSGPRSQLVVEPSRLSGMRFPDLSLAIRNIFRRPGFAGVAITLLALGSGANAAVFSVVRGVLIRPLPFSEADRVVAVAPNLFISNEDLAYWRARTRSFTEIAAQSPGWMMGLVADGGEPIKVTGARVSDNLFKALGASAALGSTIAPGHATPGQHRVAVLSDSLWRSRFNADPSIIGRGIELDQEQHTIIGVMPPGFEVFGPGTDVWTPLQWTPGSAQFKATFSQSVGRLAPGVTPEAATRELVDLVPAMRKDLARPNQWGQTMRVQKLQEAITGDVRPALLILLGAVGLILMLAAVNLGTLVLGRSIERVGEMALRSALGASRGRLIKQLITEQAVLAVCGGVAGIAVARAILPALVARIPPEVPHVGQISLDWTVLLSVLGVSVAVAIIVALLPAAIAARPNVQPLLRQSRATETAGRRRALGSLVAVQIALAVVLGIGSMLMLRSLWNLQRVDPGFTATNVLTFRLQTTSKYRALSTGLPYLERMRERVAAMPGVIDVGLTAHLPMSGYSWTTTARRSDRPLASGEVAPSVGWRFIHSNYLQTMRIPLKYGRAFTDSDIASSTPVALLNETMARQFFVEPSMAVGQTMVIMSGRTGQDEHVQIVGVIGDIRHRGLNREPMPELFRPLTQTFMFPMAMVVRTAGAPEQIAAAVRQAAFEIDPVVPVAEMQPYTTMIAGTLGRPRLLSFLLTIFAAAGLGLGLVGVYGVVAYRVRQREREIGIRLALGARPASMAKTVVTQGLRHAIAGIAIGLPAAFLLSRVMSSMVFGVTTHDPLTFAALPILIVAVTSLACYLPARRAARVDPVVAIKQD